jgi:hypothetical protein
MLAKIIAQPNLNYMIQSGIIPLVLNTNKKNFKVYHVCFHYERKSQSRVHQNVKVYYILR